MSNSRTDVPASALPRPTSRRPPSQPRRAAPAGRRRLVEHPGSPSRKHPIAHSVGVGTRCCLTLDGGGRPRASHPASGVALTGGSDGRAPSRHGLDPGRHVLDGLRRPLSGGGARPQGQRRRLLDGPAHGHQRGVRPVREEDPVRHVRRARAGPGRLPGAAAGAAGRGVRRLPAAEHVACRWTTPTTGGPTCRAPTGASRRGRAAR